MNMAQHNRTSSSSDDDSEEEDLMNVEIYPALHDQTTGTTGTTTNRRSLHQQFPLPKPEPDFAWNNNAIQECMNMSIVSHDDALTNNTVWNAETIITPAAVSMNKESVPTAAASTKNNETVEWKPRNIPLPPWAVDPLVVSIHPPHESNQNKESHIPEMNVEHS